MSPPTADHITAAILAGGAGRRLGGVDKGWHEYEGRPLVEHVLERVRPQASRVLISANRNIDRYLALGVPVVQDPVEGYPGPLMGVVSVLRAVTTPLLLVVPCDGPDLPLDLGARLAGAFAEDVDAAVAHDGERMQPLFTLLRSSGRPSLEHFFHEGHRSMRAWLEAARVRHVDFSDCPGAFRNCNEQ